MGTRTSGWRKWLGAALIMAASSLALAASDAAGGAGGTPIAAAGGKADPTPTQEYGDFMYGRSFEDPDGHIWEVMWMDPAAIPAEATA